MGATRAPLAAPDNAKTPLIIIYSLVMSEIEFSVDPVVLPAVASAAEEDVVIIVSQTVSTMLPIAGGKRSIADAESTYAVNARPMKTRSRLATFSTHAESLVDSDMYALVAAA